jgi:hypothetical protein
MGRCRHRMVVPESLERIANPELQTGRCPDAPGGAYSEKFT